MTYILNCGDFKDVVSFTNVHEAWKALDTALPEGKLYLCKSLTDWMVYNPGDNHWYATNRNSVPIIVELKAKECGHMNIVAFTKVRLPFGWMSNMSPHPINLVGLTWRTSEALFQACRFAQLDPMREKIRSQTSPMAAKMVAKGEKDKMVITPQSKEDLHLMKVVLELKLEQHPQLRTELESTGDSLIIEDCTKRQHGSGLFWGAGLQADGTWLGENHLGKLWMSLRDQQDQPDGILLNRMSDSEHD